MQTLVLRIPDDLAAEIAAEARRLNTTKSEVARARLAAAREPANASGAGFDLIADLVGADAGGPADVSARKKHYLKSTGFGREKPRR
jgi:hypothetical protein